MRSNHDRLQASAAKRRSLPLLLAGALALASCGGGASEGASPDEASETTAAAAPIVQAISGNQVDFGDALTQDTVLWFWAPW